ncbi:protein required for normal CLN1 and CLN2 G1 cyclin expression [Malassezia psittaci]|uniref:Protein required for normal CLN1 and CLN2 G1 cyclin expression n=1 Tax=Malassezia psittaci TaxID=1821823 RepID=A0AAF0F8H5_9BASI|nr:protein required for normal CLN1 and CLN2 G1 cyclin expression [Malassezia psittaci]
MGDVGTERDASHKSLELVLATNESITIDLDPLPSTEELEVVIEILTEEKPAAYFWTALASRCWNAGRRQEAELIVSKGCTILPVHRPEESSALFALRAAFQMAEARAAPKQILSEARYQMLHDKKTKDQHFRDANEALSRAQSLNAQQPVLVQSRAVFALVTGDNALAGKLFDSILQRVPRHGIALMGKACVLLRAKQFLPALHLYQQALRVVLQMEQHAKAMQDPSLSWKGSDPRIGLGLCLWNLGRHDQARRAWRRAIDTDQQHSAAPRLLLGISLVNAAKSIRSIPHGWYGAYTEHAEDVARRTAYAEGLVLLQSAWRLDKSKAMTAVALSAHLLSQAMQYYAQALPAASDFSTPITASLPTELQDEIHSLLERTLKLCEHAIQYADSKSPVLQAWLQYAHALHINSRLARNTGDHALRLQAQRYYTRAGEELARMPPVLGLADPEGTQHQLSHGLALATLGLAQLQAESGDLLAALSTLEAEVSRPSVGSNHSYAIELGLFAALLHLAPQPGASEDQQASSRRRARILLDRTLRLAEAASRLVKGDPQDQESEQEGLLRSAELGSTNANEGALLQAQTAIENEHLAPRTLHAIASFYENARLHTELASLCALSDVHRAVYQLGAALQIAQRSDDKLLKAQLSLNMGALLVQHGAALLGNAMNHAALRTGITLLEQAFVAADDAASDAADGAAAVKVLANYDLGRAFEAIGEVDQASDAYRALLSAHPEYVDARVRYAVLAAQQVGNISLEAGITRPAREVANGRFKDALSCDPGNLDTRAMYIRFLAGEYASNRQAAWPAIKELAAQLFLGPDAGKSLFGDAATAKRAADEARHDALILSILGWTYYQLGLHVAPGPSQKAERSKNMLRAADLFDKALGANPQCVFAAQGLIILLADDALGDANAPPDTMEERRKKAAEDAIVLFGRLRELRDDASVYIGQGHAFMLRSELERALHVYDLALRRYHNERNPMVLQYVARAEYALGLRDKEFGRLQAALSHLDTAAEVLQERSADSKSSSAVERKQVLYNKAVMAQKALQMLCDLPVEQQQVSALEEAIEWVTSMQPLFLELEEAAKQRQLLYITAEVVEQRAKYAETSLLRQATKQLEDAKAYAAQREEQLRALDEKQRAKEAELEEMRRQREEEHRRRAEAIASSRRKAREEASQIEYIQEPDLEPKRRATGGKRKKKDTPQGQQEQQRQEAFIANDSDDELADDLFREDDSDSDSPSDPDSDQPEEQAGNQAAVDDQGDQAEAASAPKSTRDKLALLAKQRKQRNQPEGKREKKRRSRDKADRTAKKPKVNNDMIDSDEEMNL